MIAARQFGSIVRLKNDTLDGLGRWSSAQLFFKPSPGEWTALEVIDHLARTDASITAQLRAGSASPVPLSLMNRAAGVAFNLMFRRPIRVKTPASAIAILPSAPPDLETVSAKWNASLEELGDFLTSLQTVPAGGVFTHPVAGPMALPTALAFMETHTRHHLHQLARLRKAAAAG